MALTSRTWDDPPRASADLRAVDPVGGQSAKPTVPLAVETSPGQPAPLFQNPLIPRTLATPPGRLDKVSIVLQLDRLKDLSPDWNGYGAEPIDPGLIEQAKGLIGRLPGDIIDTPAVVPMTRGRLQFEWHRGNRSLELEFESKGRLHYLKADDDSGIDEEAILLAAQTPEIEALLRWFSSE